MPSLLKNIIAFPQELSEVKQLLHFWSSVSPNDIVDVEPLPGVLCTAARTHVLSEQHDLFTMQHTAGISEFVKLGRIRQRVQLLWRPEDLRDIFIVLRPEKDLRVRRYMLKRI